MYIPKSKFRIDTAAEGEFTTQEGAPYRGPVIRVANGQVFEGSSLETAGAPLVKVNEQIPEIEEPFNEYPKPTEEEREAGVFSRYFIINLRSSQLTEVKAQQYRKKSNIVGYGGFTIPWYLRGLGAVQANKTTINTLQPKYPNIELFLQPYQFVV